MSEGSKGPKRVPGKVFWPLMAASGAVLGGYYVVVHIGAVLERLKFGPTPRPPVTDLSGNRDGDEGTGPE